jgi:hypothetical protein
MELIIMIIIVVVSSNTRDLNYTELHVPAEPHKSGL